MLYTLNCIPLLFKLLRVSGVPLNVQELAMALLSKLVMLPNSREVILNKGGIPLILTLLQQHSNEAEMVFCGLSCLSYLLFDSYCCSRL